MLPAFLTSGGCVSAGDYDLDGDLDLFVGGRVVPGDHPAPAMSHLLENIKGKFIDVTLEKAPQLIRPGLITSSIWTDFDGDGDEDLIVIGEWTDILFYQNNNGKLAMLEKAFGLDAHVGWWNSIQAADLDGDGDEDYILGNLGLNYKYQATDDRPFEIYGSDIDGNGKRDIIMGYYAEDILFPVRGFQCSSEQMPQLAEKFPTYRAFGEADLFEVYGEALDTSLHYEANDFSSLILWNDGLTFNAQPLPIQAQWAPIQDFIVTDLNDDNQLDIIAAGNWFVAEIETPRADSGTGIVMMNKGGRKFQALTVVESGLFANHDVRGLGIISQGNTKPSLLLVANNNNALQVFKMKNK